MEIYVSTDVEADGPIPGPSSMLSFASAAYTVDKKLLSTFSANLETLQNLGRPSPADAADPLVERLERIIRADTHLMQLLKVVRAANLPQWRVVAGCVYQTVWNSLTGRPTGTGISDYDVIYFDDTDFSEESEAAIASRISFELPAFPAPIEVCNQARVHLWFENHFGITYPPLSSADEGMTRYASLTHAVGVRLMSDDRLDIFAPFGLHDIFDMIVRPNYALPNKVTHEQKAARARATWPELKIIPWNEGLRSKAKVTGSKQL